MLILSGINKVRDKKMSNKHDNRLPFSKLFERTLSNQLSTVLIFILFVSFPRDVQPKFESSSNYGTMVENIYLLKKALSMYPSSVWVYKDRFPTLRHLLLEKDDLDKSIHNRQSPRLGKIMEKVLRGENIKILVIGGSNSAGGGLQEDEHSINGTFYNILTIWWAKTITPATGSKLKIKVIAIGGTQSTFFQFCYKVFLEDFEYDIAIIEMSVNDAKGIEMKNANKAQPMEQLTRQLMNRENRPAIFYVNLFTTKIPIHGCFNLMDLGQSLLCDHYDITTINLRDTICRLNNNGGYNVTTKAIKIQSKDCSHIGLLGHAQIALMLLKVISRKLVQLIGYGNDNKDHPRKNSITRLPPPVYIKSQRNIISKPLCWTTVLSNYNKHIHNSLKVSVFKSKGFVIMNPVLIGGIKYSGHVYRTDAYGGWWANKKDSQITFAFNIMPTEEHRLHSTRSVGLITRQSPTGGEVEAWMDDCFKKRVRIHLKKFYFRKTDVSIIAVHVPLGRHTLNVRITKGGDVPLTGIVIGPPDGPY